MADDAIPEVIRAAWQALGTAWEDQARHDGFISLVAQHNCFAWAAARYKERAPDAIAARQLERLRNATTAALFATATTHKAKTAGGTPYKSTLTVLLALVVATVCGLVYAMMLHTTRR